MSAVLEAVSMMLRLSPLGTPRALESSDVFCERCVIDTSASNFNWEVVSTPSPIFTFSYKILVFVFLSCKINVYDLKNIRTDCFTVSMVSTCIGLNAFDSTITWFTIIVYVISFCNRCGVWFFLFCFFHVSQALFKIHILAVKQSSSVLCFAHNRPRPCT